MEKQEVLTLIIESVRDVLPDVQEQEVRETDSIKDLGGNSVERAEIVMQVLERMDLDIPLVETYGPQNLGELAEDLSAKCR